MAKKTKPSIINLVPAYLASPLDTSAYIDSKHNRPRLSPISEYNTESAIIRKYANPVGFDSNLANWLLLAQVSLAESYFRAVIRKTILLDEYSHAKVANLRVTYAAAHYLSRDMMPESLLEGESLASAHNLKEAFRNLLGLTGEFTELLPSLSNYGKVCQLRHCIIHRFSYLGSSNAAILGIDSHSGLIEKPIVFDFASLQSAFEAVDVCVRAVNNYLFTHLIYRLADNNKWTWKYSTDSIVFKRYYNIFIDKTDAGYLLPKAAYLELEREKK